MQAAKKLPVSQGQVAALSITGMSKHFGATKALQNVKLTIEAGEIHAFLGANGAGKSTLIKVLAGVYKPDGGQIALRGVPVENGNIGHRVSFVHQDLGLVDTMSVGENMAMAYGYPRRRGLIDWKAVDARAKEALDNLGAPLPLDLHVGELSQAEKSIVAIARALTRDIDVLVLDEPTASLPEKDVERLFAILRRLKARNVGIIYVSHRLDEVFRIADAATVLRDGKVVANYRPINIPPEQLIADICGKLPQKRIASQRERSNDFVMEVNKLCIGHVGPVSFNVGASEILGLAGLRGQGHEAVGRALAGIQPSTSGSITVLPKKLRFDGPASAIAAGVGFASSKRAEEGLAPALNVRENLFLNPGNFKRKLFSFLTAKSEADNARSYLEQFDVRPRGSERDITTLSGGNQQKVILARLAGRDYSVLVLEEPTVGVDVGAKAEIYRILADRASKGCACVVISSDLDELVQLCDRVFVFGAGKIIAEMHRDELTVESLTTEITGASSVSLDSHTPSAVA